MLLAHTILSHLQASFSSASRLYDLSIDGIQEASAAGQTSTGLGQRDAFVLPAHDVPPAKGSQ
jgi:hypothetical protein